MTPRPAPVVMTHRDPMTRTTTLACSACGWMTEPIEDKTLEVLTLQPAEVLRRLFAQHVEDEHPSSRGP